MKRLQNKTYREHLIGLILTLGISVVAFLILILQDGLDYLHSVLVMTMQEWLLVMVSGAIWGYVMVAFRRHSLLRITCITICALLGMGVVGVWAIKLAELNWSLLFLVASLQQAIGSVVSIIVLEFKDMKNERRIPE